MVNPIIPTIVVFTLSLYEKISLLTKELFEFYIERIKLKKEDINKIGNV